MSTALHHGLLAVATLALGGFALRLASTLAPRGLERAVIAMVFGASAAIAEALVLGLGGLGASPAALPAAAVATWLAARALLPEPETRVASELSAAWRGLTRRGRALWGAAAGVTVGWIAFFLRYPALGEDSVSYHLPSVVQWVHSGRPGTVDAFNYWLPHGNYPQTNEALLTWACGIARSFVPVALWTPATLALLAAAGWVGLRALGVPRLVRGAAVAALCASPLVVQQLFGPNTDLPALAWLVSAAALVACARPALLAPALLAGALAVGTKTTMAPLGAVVLAIGFWRHRAALRPLARPLALAALAGLAVGGTWYLRNLIGRGSPLWPLVDLPWGDPAPPLVDQLDTRFIERPERTLENRVDDYLNVIAGGLVLCAGALAAPLLARSRAVAFGAAAVALALVAWVLAPFTGVGDAPELEHVALSTTRYLLPPMAAAALTLALAARRGAFPRAFALAAFAAAFVWSVVRDAVDGFPYAPSVGTLATSAVLGAVTGLAIRGGPRRGGLVTSVPLRDASRQTPVGSRLRPALAATVFVTLIAAVGAAGAPGYLQRHGEAGLSLFLYDRDISVFFALAPDFADGDSTVAMAPALAGPLAGDTLDHDVELIQRDESCERIAERLRTQWLVVSDLRGASFVPDYSAPDCLAGREPAFEDELFKVYAPGGQTARK
jgi:hypothetical protein